MAESDLGFQLTLLAFQEKLKYPLTMSQTLKQEQIEQFHLNGFLVVENVLSAAELDTLDRHCDLIASGKAEHIPDTSIQLEPVFREGKRPVEDRVLAVRKLYDLSLIHI